jgi:hypothetical protein
VDEMTQVIKHGVHFEVALIGQKWAVQNCTRLLRWAKVRWLVTDVFQQRRE